MILSAEETVYFSSNLIFFAYAFEIDILNTEDVGKVQFINRGLYSIIQGGIKIASLDRIASVLVFPFDI